jgi:hypothetical protein
VELDPLDAFMNSIAIPEVCKDVPRTHTILFCLSVSIHHLQKGSFVNPCIVSVASTTTQIGTEVLP